MEFKLTRDQKRLRKDVLCFASEQLSVEGGRPAPFSNAIWKKCGESKITGLHIPKEFEGLGYDTIDTSLALEGLGAGGAGGSIVMSLAAHLFSVTTPLLFFGSETQKQLYLPSLAEGSLMGASAMTESHTGTWHSDLTTVAEQDGDAFILRGEKSFSINAPEAHLFLIYANTGQHPQKDLSCFIVLRDTAGLTVTTTDKAVGATDTPVGQVRLEDVCVPASALLGKWGQGAAIYQLARAWERSLIGAAYVGWQEKLVERCIKEARTRKQGDVPIGKHQSVSHKITDMKISLEVSRLLSRKAAWTLMQPQPDPSYGPASKLFASESMTKSALDALHIFGDYSILNEFQLNTTLQQAIDSHFLGGSAQAQRASLAKALGL